MKRKAPWPDFAGKAIHEGDWIEHPNGDRARVVYSLDPRHDGVSRWRAIYENDESLWLGNQIGDKWRAVVVQPQKPGAWPTAEAYVPSCSAPLRRRLARL